MVKGDEPIPVERTGADPVTPDAVRARARGIFEDVDLSIPGTYPMGPGLIDVSGHHGEGQFHASLDVHGITLANMGRSGDGEYCLLKGKDRIGREIQVSLRDFGDSDSERVIISRRTIQRVSGNFVKVVDEFVEDPSERIEIAEMVGIRV